MKKLWQKVISICLVSICLILGMQPQAYAAQEGNYTYTVVNGQATVTNYTGSASEVIIPDSLGGYPVTGIGTGCFHYDDFITVVTLPDTVTSIGESAFAECSSLQSVTFSDNLVTIGKNAFYLCWSLNGVELPQTLVSIGDSAFYQCSRFTQIDIPDSVTSLGTGVFSQCTRLTDVWLSSNLSSIPQNTFIGCIQLAAIDIPGNILSIGASAFSNCGLLSVTIREGVVSIGDKAFNSCIKLSSVSLPTTITTIGSQAFYGSQMTNLTLPTSLRQMGLGAFSNCTKLSNLTIPEGVSVIGEEGFRYCSSLETVILPTTINDVGGACFASCTNLRYVYFRGPKVNLDASEFGSTAAGFKIYINVNYVASWQTLQNWYMYWLNRSLTVCEVVFDYSYENRQDGQLVIQTNHASEPPEAIRTGYTCSGWFKEAACQNAWNFANDTVSANITLYAKWTPNDYTVMYNINGGDGGATANSSHVYDTSRTLTANGFTRTGYAFTGWAASPDEPAIYTDGQSVLNLTSANDAAVTLYAKWTPNEYTVIYDKNGGDGGSTASSYHVYDTPRALTANGFTRTGYTFAGWAAIPNSSMLYTDGQSVMNLTPVNGVTVTLYAMWTANTYTIIYHQNGGGGTTTSSSHVYDTPRTLTANGFTRTGYSFTGWAASPDGSVLYTDGQSVLNLVPENGAMVTLYAQWTPIAYTVVYAGNDSDGGVTASSNHVYDAPQTLTLNGFTKTGYTFVGWATSSVGPAVYTNGQSVLNLASTNGVITLWAQWTPFAPPASPKATATSYNSVQVAWSAVSGASGYEVWQSTSTATGYTLAASVAGTSSTRIGLLTGTVYYYKIRAFLTMSGVKHYSLYTAAVSAQPTLTTPSTKATATSYNSIKVTWSAVSGAGGYEVWRSTGSGYTLAASVAGTSATNTNLATGTTYYYKVRAYRTMNGVKVYGAYSSVVSAKPMLATPVSPKATATSYNSVQVTWSAVSGASGYQVWRSTGSGYTLAATVTGTSATNTSLATGTTYYYRVRAYRTVDGIKVYGANSTVVSIRTVPATPASPKSTALSYNTIRVTWNAAGGAGGYEVWRSTAAASGFTLAATTAATSHISTGLATGTTYYYKVRAYRTVNGVKVYGAYSSVVSAKPVLAAVTNLKTTTISYNSVKLTWSAVSGAGGYEVWQSTGSSYKLATVVAGTSSTRTGLATGMTYYYKIRAYRTVSGIKVYGAYSPTASAKPMLATPTSIKATRVSAGRVKVSWAAVAGAMKYEVWRATSSGGTYARIVETSSTDYSNTGLTTGKTYYYKVRAYRFVNSTKVYGGHSAVVSVKP